MRGRASIEIVDGLVPEYIAAARRSIGAEAAAEFETSCREMYDHMARIAIVPNWVRFYDFGTGRMPTFLKELSERNGPDRRRGQRDATAMRSNAKEQVATAACAS